MSNTTFAPQANGVTHTHTRGRGQPTSYTPEYVERARDYCMLGAKNVDLARLFNVDVRTIDNWLATHEDFFRAVKSGREEADAKMAASLYHRGIGYTHKAVKIFMPAGATEPVYAPYEEHYPPDTAAAFIWLKNRQPELWRDYKAMDVRVKHEHNLGEDTRDYLASLLSSLAEEDSSIIDAQATVIEDKSESK